jgi:hypothetical protein
MLLEPVTVECPYCGETFATTADCSGGSQRYIEDCPVCCRPIEFTIVTGPDQELVSLSTGREDD